MARKGKTNRQRVNDALDEIRRAKRDTAFYRSFGPLHNDDRQHFTIPKELQPFIKQEFELWWDSWVAPQLLEIELATNPVSKADGDLIEAKAGVA